MSQETPYQRHAKKGHAMSTHSPNGIDIIEECLECGGRWLLTPAFDYPITLDPRAAIAQATEGGA